MGIAGLVLTAALLGFNLFTFPTPPAEAGLVDVGPAIGLYIKTTRNRKRRPKWLKNGIAASRGLCHMPTICIFYGIVIKMYWNEHTPPHFHVEYGDYRAQYVIATLELRKGSLPRRAHVLVLEWAAMHRSELLEDWQLCEAKQHPKKISPLV